MKRTATPDVLLDLTHREARFARGRFPRIYERCLRYGIDLERQAVPVAPAAHYAMGGVWTDLDGRTNVDRLFAAGEVACTGVHGSNRLASNSLLEGVAFGARAGRAMREAGEAHAAFDCGEVIFRGQMKAALTGESACPTQRIAWEKCGILRDGAGLREACRQLEPHWGDNAALVALLIARCALAREESRGANFRSDYPEKRDAFAWHSVVGKNTDVLFR